MIRHHFKRSIDFPSAASFRMQHLIEKIVIIASGFVKLRILSKGSGSQKVAARQVKGQTKPPNFAINWWFTWDEWTSALSCLFCDVHHSNPEKYVTNRLKLQKMFDARYLLASQDNIFKRLLQQMQRINKLCST